MAIDHGVKVIINCSWGGKSVIEKPYERGIINDAIAKGCLILSVAVNIRNPTTYPEVFTVVNVDSLDKEHFSSAYKDYVSIAAPGTNILSTLSKNSYNYATGTSQDTPIVSSASSLGMEKISFMDCPANNN